MSSRWLGSNSDTSSFCSAGGKTIFQSIVHMQMKWRRLSTHQDCRCQGRHGAERRRNTTTVVLGILMVSLNIYHNQYSPNQRPWNPRWMRTIQTNLTMHNILSHSKWFLYTWLQIVSTILNRNYKICRHVCMYLFRKQLMHVEVWCCKAKRLCQESCARRAVHALGGSVQTDS